jgi:hypothetical protein
VGGHFLQRTRLGCGDLLWRRVGEFGGCLKGLTTRKSQREYSGREHKDERVASG